MNLGYLVTFVAPENQKLLFINNLLFIFCLQIAKTKIIPCFKPVNLLNLNFHVQDGKFFRSFYKLGPETGADSREDCVLLDPFKKPELLNLLR